MNALMIIKSLRICECLAADVTGVRPLPSVALPNVSDHLLFPEKTFAADMANMCFFPCVGSDVAFEVMLFVIPLRAQMTGKGFFASTYNPVLVTVFLNQPIDFCIILFKIIARISNSRVMLYEMCFALYLVS